MSIHLSNCGFPIHQIALVLATLPLAACSATSVLQNNADRSSDFSQAISSHGAAALYSEQKSISSAMAVVRLRDRQVGILSASQRSYQNGFSQRVVYPMASNGQGENYIETRVAGRKLDRKRNDKLSLHSTRASNIIADASRSLPTAKLNLGQQDAYRNTYGPYGMIFVTGTNNHNCLFGWQTLTDDNPSFSDGNGLGSSAKWPSRQGLSYRLRYCQTGLQKADAQDLMERIELAPSFARLWQNGAAVSLAPLAIAEPAVKVTTAKSPVRVKLAKKRKTQPDIPEANQPDIAVPRPEIGPITATNVTLPSITVPSPDGPMLEVRQKPIPTMVQTPDRMSAKEAYLVPSP